MAEAKPLIVFVVAKTCFRSMYAVEFAAIAESFCISISSNNIVNVAAVPAVLHIAILDITVVVDAGTVYRVALDVDAAPRKSALVIVAIIYYLSY